QLRAQADELRSRLADAGRTAATSASTDRQRLTQLVGELAEATSARTSAEDTINQLRFELKRAASIEEQHRRLRAQAEELRSRLADAERTAATSASTDRQRLTQLVGELAEATSARSSAEDTINQLRAELKRAASIEVQHR